MKQFVWKIGGEAGFGVMTTGLLFAKTAARYGYHIFDYAEYPSLIRGGHNAYEVSICNEPIGTVLPQIDMLVCLNQDTYNFHAHRLHAGSIVVFDPTVVKIDKPLGTHVEVPFQQINKDLGGIEIMKNTIAMGASLALMGWPMDELKASIEKSFGKKSQELVDKNIAVAQRGFDVVMEKYADAIVTDFPMQKQVDSKIVLGGNDAFSMAAVAADCRYYSAYPMTPASSVLSTLAGWAEKTGMVVRHVEDEVAVINGALGAAFGGVRAAVGSSGGGFALMVEALSFSGIAEIPIVVFLSQRPGPATGLPTWTEQGDLLFAVHAGHGEFPKIVLAPGDPAEMAELTLKAFDLADIYQTPVIVMSDKVLSESHYSVSEHWLQALFATHLPNRGKIVREAEAPYLRYKITEDGISPMLIPGQKGVFYQANSYEHVEDGHTTEDIEPRKQQVEKRARKQTTYLAQHFAAPQYIGDASAETVVVSYGSNKGVILEAQRVAEEQGKPFGYLHFTHIFPLDEAKVKACFDPKKRYMLVENSSQGQLGTVLRAYAGVEITEKILRYDGRPLSVQEIVEGIKK